MSENMPIKECRLCKKMSPDHLRCSRCKQAYYCNQECQKQDWASHKSYCKIKSPEDEVKKPESKEIGLDEF